jgi:predicted RND superfamily exporter protein
MPILAFTEDHKAETIDRVLAAVRGFDLEGFDGVRFRLAGGNVGVMAATNESVSAAQFPMLLYIYAVVVLLCLLVFRSVAATVCIVLPLALTSVLGYALMAYLEIGLKVSTLPVIALGTGIGVDYGIYVFASFRQAVRGRGLPFEQAMAEALRGTGNAVLFTGLTLAVGVSTWIFSALRFQADMGLLLTFMFLMNMVGAVVLLPALATWLVGRRRSWPTPAHPGG